MAIDQGGVVIGAPLDNNANGLSSGAVYTFSIECPADISRDWYLDFDDVNMFVTAYTFGGTAADFTDDGLVNFFDISAFFMAFAAGCP